MSGVSRRSECEVRVSFSIAHLCEVPFLTFLLRSNPARDLGAVIFARRRRARLRVGFREEGLWAVGEAGPWAVGKADEG